MANPASVLTPGDITAPPVPTTAVVPYTRGLQVSSSIVRPVDFKEFSIDKRVSAPAGSATAFAFWRVSRDGNEIDYEVVYGLTYEYRAFSRDTTGNFSAYGNTASGTANQITSGDIAFASIQTAHIGNAQITSAHIGNAQILTAHIANAQITSAHIGNAQIQTAHISNLAVTSATIADLNVTTLKIAGSAVTTGKIGSGAVSQTVYDIDFGSQSTTGSSFVKYSNITATLTPFEFGTLFICAIKCEFSLTNNGASAQYVRGAINLQVAAPGSPSGVMAGLKFTAFLQPGESLTAPFSFTHIDGPRNAVSTPYEIWFRIEFPTNGSAQALVIEPSLQVTELKR